MRVELEGRRGEVRMGPKTEEEMRKGICGQSSKTGTLFFSMDKLQHDTGR